MSIKRSLNQPLIEWKQAAEHQPILLRGARQVGKSHLVRRFAEAEFEQLVEVNFELFPEYKPCFDTLRPQDICQKISLLSQQKIIPGHTLLFLDEIQDCPAAVQSLRYFKELMPELHVIGAGSLLELMLKHSHFRMPVGRVNFMHLYPCSFKEFLQTFHPQIYERLGSVSFIDPLDEATHQFLLKQLKLYLFCGGMPAALAQYPQHESASFFNDVQMTQASILNTYIDDFGHYSQYADVFNLRQCFSQVPQLVGQQIKYSQISSNKRASDIKVALDILEDVGIFHRVEATAAQGLPLSATVNPKKFKLNFIDVGLVKRMNQLDGEIVFKENVMLLNRGMLAEQFVGQELLAYAPFYERPELYFWAKDRAKSAEVDYVKAFGSSILPIEVKAGVRGSLKSWHEYMRLHKTDLGVRISEHPLSFKGGLLSVPLYMLFELDRLVALLAS